MRLFVLGGKVWVVVRGRGVVGPRESAKRRRSVVSGVNRSAGEGRRGNGKVNVDGTAGWGGTERESRNCAPGTRTNRSGFREIDDRSTICERGMLTLSLRVGGDGGREACKAERRAKRIHCAKRKGMIRTSDLWEWRNGHGHLLYDPRDASQ